VLDTHDVALEPFMPGLDAIARAVAIARAAHQDAEAPKATVAREPAGVDSRLRITRRYLGAWYLQVVRGLLPWLPRRCPRPVAVQADCPPMQPRNHVEPVTLPEQGVKPKTPDWTPAPCRFELSGVVFTALFNPYDGRKNW